jgi:hypothetical protein
MVRDSVAAAQCAAIMVLTDGRVRLLDSASTILANSTAVLTAGSQARLEWRVVGHASTGVVEVKIFLSPHAVTPTETITVTSVNTRGSFDRFRIGQNAAAAADLGPFYLDEIAWDDAAYIGPASMPVTVPLLDASVTPLTPKVNASIQTPLLDGTATVYTPNVRRGINVEFLDATATLFTPPQVKRTLGSNSAFQNDAFQNDAFQTGRTFFVEASPVLFTPSLAQTVAVPGPSGAAFAITAFQNDAFQVGGGLDGSPIVYAPQVVAGDYHVIPALLDASGTPLAPAITANNIQPALLDGVAEVFTPTQVSMQLRMEDVGVYDSPDIVWDDPLVHWDGGGLGGFINQPGVLFAPSALTFSITVGLLDQSPTVFAPSVAPKALFVGLLNGVGFLFTPTVPLNVTVNILDASAEVLEFSFISSPSPPLLDATAQLFTPNVNPIEVDVEFLDGSGFVIAPEVHPQVTVGLLDATATLFAPAIGQIIVPLLDASGVLFTPSLTPVLPALLDASGVALEPQKVNLPFVQTVRLDDLPSGLVDASPEVYEPVSVSLGQPQVINVTYIDESATVFAPRVFQGSFTIPRTRKIATYEPVLNLRADYQPILRKEASVLGVKSPITKADAWFVGEDQTFEFLSLTGGRPDDITGWTVQFRMANKQGEPSVLTITAVLTDPVAGVFQIPTVSVDTASLEPEVYYYDVSRLDSGSNQVLAFGPAHLQARVS